MSQQKGPKYSTKEREREREIIKRRGETRYTSQFPLLIHEQKYPQISNCMFGGLYATFGKTTPPQMLSPNIKK